MYGARCLNKTYSRHSYTTVQDKDSRESLENTILNIIYLGLTSMHHLLHLMLAY
jgi:hypothetical protein